MHELLTVAENGEIHFQITKNENVPILVESFKIVICDNAFMASLLQSETPDYK